MYAFYSLLIYIFYSLFRRDGGAAAAADPGDPAQRAGCKPRSRRHPDRLSSELWTELTGLAGCSDSGDGLEARAEGRPAEVSLEEALLRLAEFLSVQLGAEEGGENPPNLDKPGEVPPLLTLTSQLLALLTWIQSPRGRQALLQGTQPTSPVQLPTLDGSLSPEESPSYPTPILNEVPRGEAQGWRPSQLGEDQGAWQRLEQLILGQLEELRQQLEQQEEELGRLRLGVGATDSEKRVQHLTLENEALKQSLSLTRDLLLHWGPSPATRPSQLPPSCRRRQRLCWSSRAGCRRPKTPQKPSESSWECRRCSCRAFEGPFSSSSRRQSRTADGSCSRCMGSWQVRAGGRGLVERPLGIWAFLLNIHPPPGLRARMASLRQGCGDLRGLVSTFTQSCQGSLSEAQGQVSWALGALSSERAVSQHPEGHQRPPTGCPGRLLELKGNIRVLCRLRPGTSSSLMNLEPGPGGSITTCYRGRQRRFCLDWVFPPDASQEEVFSQLEPAVLSCLRGYSVCIFTYGQTGSGKTYSMEGPPEDPGIAPRALQSLFQEMETGGQHRVTLSMVEIYNEAVRDLLAPGPPERLVLRQGAGGHGGIQVAGLTHWDVPDLKTLHQMLSLGRSNRATAATAMNQHSSRSHALVTLRLCSTASPCAPGTAGTLHLVDLAGSERAWKVAAASTSRGDPNGPRRLREAQTINRSLLALGGVMAALRARRPHVPFRDSKLTRLLQPALGPGTTAVLLLQISTRPEDLGETVCSLKFAERVGQVELGPARRHSARGSATPSSLSTDTPLTGTPCTPTPSPGSPASHSLGSCSGLDLSAPGSLPP
ncbi:kinesin-like protein KIFC2 isoform X1 [Perognathus longimembris pacificus]|uniref:kinesin-like protein KIFC2 isoform X1 n=1 Tax=Perognathus longimembris pacificus TaxID=214514 RepID=UPI002018A4B1|nr:kinesin-like protein KIFC2 isoform X1 [Perognathus longimembris pacificus]